MIIRQSFRARLLPKASHDLAVCARQCLSAVQNLGAKKRILTTSLFCHGLDLFWYVESFGAPLPPSEALEALAPLLEAWPGESVKRLWIPMIEVFHFCSPESEEYWQRRGPVASRLGKIARLRPERVASYVYFHYQLQEERAFPGEKYKFICMHENLLFLYDEAPPVIESPASPGRLSSHGTPTNWTDARMDLHFIPWDEQTPFFRQIESVFNV